MVEYKGAWLYGAYCSVCGEYFKSKSKHYKQCVDCKAEGMRARNIDEDIIKAFIKQEKIKIKGVK
jgi:hypothetical protein